MTADELNAAQVHVVERLRHPVPAIGRTVIYVEGDYELGVKMGVGGTPQPTPDQIAAVGQYSGGTNGTRAHPAVITRVWSDTCVNLCVFFDAKGPEPRNSVPMMPALPEGVGDASGISGWRWPVVASAQG